MSAQELEASEAALAAQKALPEADKEGEALELAALFFSIMDILSILSPLLAPLVL